MTTPSLPQILAIEVKGLLIVNWFVNQVCKVAVQVNFCFFYKITEPLFNNKITNLKKTNKA